MNADTILHTAVCNAVATLNVSPEIARIAEGRTIRDTLRQALVDYADALMEQPTNEAEQQSMRRLHGADKQAAPPAARPTAGADDSRMCPECGAKMLFDEGEPWEGSSFGCVDCGFQEPVGITDQQFCEMATRAFPRWHEDIQAQFVTQLGRAIERELRAAPAAPAPAPDGFVLVPVEPTEAMLRAHTGGSFSKAGFSWARHQWAAMLAARPAAQEQKT